MSGFSSIVLVVLIFNQANLHFMQLYLHYIHENKRKKEKEKREQFQHAITQGLTQHRQ